MSDIAFDPFRGAHPCAKADCKYVVLYDDEPYCYKHFLDAGSRIRGYSYKRSQAKGA